MSQSAKPKPKSQRPISLNRKLASQIFARLTHLPVPKTARCYTLTGNESAVILAIITRGRARYVTIGKTEIHAEGFLVRTRDSRKVCDAKFPRNLVGGLQAAAQVLGTNLSNTRACEIFAGA